MYDGGTLTVVNETKDEEYQLLTEDEASPEVVRRVARDLIAVTSGRIFLHPQSDEVGSVVQ